MNEIDCLERTQHDLELAYAARLISLDEVYSIDKDPVDFSLKLEHRVRGTYDLAHVPKAPIEEDVARQQNLWVNLGSGKAPSV